jgi:hypothetical protein
VGVAGGGAFLLFHSDPILEHLEPFTATLSLGKHLRLGCKPIVRHRRSMMQKPSVPGVHASNNRACKLEFCVSGINKTPICANHQEFRSCKATLFTLAKGVYSVW